MLGFQNYRGSNQINRANKLPRIRNDSGFQGNHNMFNHNMGNNEFVYNPEEFPATMNNELHHKSQTTPHATPTQINNNNFLELMESIKLIQQNQVIFQQEIMHLKMQNPPPQQQMYAGVYKVPSQNPAQIPSTNI